MQVGDRVRVLVEGFAGHCGKVVKVSHDFIYVQLDESDGFWSRFAPDELGVISGSFSAADLQKTACEPVPVSFFAEGDGTELPYTFIAKKPDSHGREIPFDLSPRQDRALDSGSTTGYKRDAGKARLGLIDPAFIEGLGRVLTMGAEKYGLHNEDGSKDTRAFNNNWSQGMTWSRVYDAAQRHLNQFWSGEDTDSESGESHLYHAAFGLMALAYYSKRHRHFDDRDLPWRKRRRVGLDVDGVICNTFPPVLRLLQLDGPWANGDMPHYSFPPEIFPWWNERDDDEDFWLSMEPLIQGVEMPFEPKLYLTARRGEGAGRYVEPWLRKNGFPPAKVVCSKNKVSVLKEHGIEVYVEDKFENFVEINNAGILCYLMDQPYNRKHDVGGLRITSLTEVWK